MAHNNKKKEKYTIKRAETNNECSYTIWEYIPPVTPTKGEGFVADNFGFSVVVANTMTMDHAKLFKMLLEKHEAEEKREDAERRR